MSAITVVKDLMCLCVTVIDLECTRVPIYMSITSAGNLKGRPPAKYKDGEHVGM